MEIYQPLQQFCDKGTRHRYISTYDKLFAEYKAQPITVLELGVLGGGSLLLWRYYFNRAKIIGVDINPECLRLNNPRYDIYVVQENCSSPEVLEKIPDTIHICIDDASHELDNTVASLKLIYPRIAKNGLYIIEDVPDIELWKSKIDVLGFPYFIVDTRDINPGVHDDVLFVFKKI